MALQYEDIQKKYPKALAELGKFMKISLEAFQKSVMEEFSGMGNTEEEFEIPQLTPDIIEDSIKNLFSAGTMRTLYDFFDRNEVYVNITAPKPHEKNWKWEVDDAYSNGGYPTRSSAELRGFEMAFENLEGRL